MPYKCATQQVLNSTTKAGYQKRLFFLLKFSLTFWASLFTFDYNKMEAIAKLRNYPTSPRRMRLLADEIRGMEVEKALALLEHHPQHSATPLFKLLKSAINNWEQKNEGTSAADAGLVVKTIYVDGARTLKRMLPAPQGRAYRLRKRSNHVTLAVDVKQ